MVPDSDKSILEAVFAAIRGAGRLGNEPIVVGDNLKDLGLSRLRLLATVIELEDKFDIEFPTDTVDCFRVVADIAAYIQSHAVIVHGDANKRAATAGAPIARGPSVGDRLRQFCARAFRRISDIAVPAG